ncbi:MAG: outer membrane biosynthesis protein TonB [Saprospiraceae bacterium]|jgi:outer membrane biosynthesis protein TonB
MKNRIKLFVLGLFLTSGLVAQTELPSGNPSNNQDEINKSTSLSNTTEGDMSENIAEELKVFREYLANEIQYPELAQLYSVEGVLIIRVVFDGNIRKIEVVQSIYPDCDKYVVEKIKEYARNWDKKDLENIPLLTFNIPLYFRLEG